MSVAFRHHTDPADDDPLVSSDCTLGFLDFLNLSSFPERVEADGLDLREASG